MAGKFLDIHPDFTFLDGQQWKILKEFDYRLGSPDGIEYVRIPAGFVSDFASIPEVLRNILPPSGTRTEPYGLAAVVHDWLYQRRLIQRGEGVFACYRYCTRAEADSTLLEAMQVLGVGVLTRYTIYLGVHWFGWITWNRYRKQEAK